MIILFYYNDTTYIHGDIEPDSQISNILLAGVAYPLIYEIIQMIKAGPVDYFSDTGNLIDIVYIGSSIVMSQIHSPDVEGPYSWVSKIVMMLVVLLAVRRTFTFLRIFKPLSPIVTMLNNVIWDLRIFMTFYVILCLLLSLIYGVIGLSNWKIPGTFRDLFFLVPEDSGETERQLDGEAPYIEYYQVGLMIGHFFSVIRISLGDFALVGSSMYLGDAENIIFWSMWFLNLIVCNIVFLNFIVAEASASYSEVAE